MTTNSRPTMVYQKFPAAELTRCFQEGAAEWNRGTPCPYPVGERRWRWQQGCIAAENAFWTAARTRLAAVNAVCAA